MWTTRKRSPPLPDRILVASYVSAGRWSQTSVCYFHPESFVLFPWIGVCPIDSAEQLPRRRNQKSLALHRSWKKSFIPALFLYSIYLTLLVKPCLIRWRKSTEPEPEFCLTQSNWAWWWHWNHLTIQPHQQRGIQLACALSEKNRAVGWAAAGAGVC